MIEIPRETLESHFGRFFRTGSVWKYHKFHFQSTGETRDKYLVVLSPRAADGNAYFCFTTTNEVFFTRNTVACRNIFVIDAGNCDCFRERTAIDVSNFFDETSDVLLDRYCHSKFSQRIEYIGDLPDRIIEQIRLLFLASADVPIKIKNLVFPNPVQPG